jgi:hypothetical protein
MSVESNFDQTILQFSFFNLKILHTLLTVIRKNI